MDIHDVTLGYTTTMTWNTRDQWIVSEKIAHTPLVDDTTFTAAQRILAARGRSATGAKHQRHRTRHPYVFRGLIHCGLCGRLMQPQHSHDNPYYRCCFPDGYALANRIAHPRNLYLRENWLTGPLHAWLARIFAPAPHRRDDRPAHRSCGHSIRRRSAGR